MRETKERERFNRYAETRKRKEEDKRNIALFIRIKKMIDSNIENRDKEKIDHLWNYDSRSLMSNRSKRISRSQIDRVNEKSYVWKHRLKDRKNPKKYKYFYEIQLRPLNTLEHILEGFKKTNKQSESSRSKKEEEQIIKERNGSIRIHTGFCPRHSILKRILIIYLYNLSK